MCRLNFIVFEAVVDGGFQINLAGERYGPWPGSNNQGQRVQRAAESSAGALHEPSLHKTVFCARRRSRVAFDKFASPS